MASPADLVKVQCQMEGKRRMLGLEPRVHSTMHALRDIVKKGGIKGLWKGSIPNVHRAALVNLGDLTTYDYAKRLVMKKTGLPDCHTVHVMASICAGLVAATMGTPADVVKTRVMNQPTDSLGRYVFVNYIFIRMFYFDKIYETKEQYIIQLISFQWTVLSRLVGLFTTDS